MLSPSQENNSWPGDRKKWSNERKDFNLNRFTTILIETLRGLFGSDNNNNNKRSRRSSNLKLVIFFITASFLIWLITGFYKVDEGERGVEIILGQLSSVTDQGLRYNFPSPIGETLIKNITNVNVLKSGAKVRHKMLVAEGSSNQMVTKDLNIVEVKFSVHWTIKDIKQFVFNDPYPEETIREAAESSMREVIAQHRLDSVLRLEKELIAGDCKALLQHVLDEYGIGVNVREVLMDPPDVPESVVDSYRNLHQASSRAVTLQNEAYQYRNSILPKARGLAQEIIQQAEAYRSTVVANAEGESSRFRSLTREYEKTPRVTRDRIYIDAMRDLLSGMNKIIIDGKINTQGILPHLPLPLIDGIGKKLLEEKKRVSK